MLKEQITLKKLKHVASQSRETHCFSATIYIDNVAICDVDNDGHGGCDRYTPTVNAKVSHADVHKDIAAINKELGKETIQCDGFELENSLDLVVGDLVNKMLLEKEAKSLIRRRICYTKPGGGVYQLPTKYKPTPENFAGVAKADWWNKTCVFLKDMPLDDVCALLRN